MRVYKVKSRRPRAVNRQEGRAGVECVESGLPCHILVDAYSTSDKETISYSRTEGLSKVSR